MKLTAKGYTPSIRMKLFLRILPSENTKDRIELYNCVNAVNETRHDSGVDVICPGDHEIPAHKIGYKIPLGIQCRVEFEDNKPRGFYVLPRSSMVSKTPLRQANSVGLIDFGYRGECMLVVDNVSGMKYDVKAGDRLCQIVAPDASPINVNIVEGTWEEETSRGEGGFGSTGR